MNRVLRLFVLGLFAASIAGCGKSEKPATSTPKADPEKMKAEMKKSFELGKPKGGKDPAKP